MIKWPCTLRKATSRLRFKELNRYRTSARYQSTMMHNAREGGSRCIPVNARFVWADSAISKCSGPFSLVY